MSGGKTISTSETRIEALSLQSSAYGVPVTLLYGTHRIAGNLLWYGGFKATPHTSTQSSGKGGGVKTQTTTYTYSASVIMGLCEGQITGISRVWKGKNLFAGGPTPVQIITATETYAVPPGGGTYTVSHAATFSAAIQVGYGGGTGQDAYWNTLAEGDAYTRVGGVYKFGADLAGITLSVQYQYTTGGASQTALQSLGLSFADGRLGQSAWSYLASFTPANPPGGATGSQSLGYSGLAHVYAQDYQLGTSASIDNHTFEVQGPQAYSISTSIPDANPAVLLADALVNGRYGAAFPSAYLGLGTAYSDYCLAAGLLMSPALTEQIKAAEFVDAVAKLTNAGPVWSSGRLKMVPYGDSDLSGNGATYTANVTPAYELTDADFIGGADPIRVTRKSQADCHNHIRIEWCNRANLYNIEIAEAKDAAAIDAYGLRSAEVLSAHWICDAAVARAVAQLILQRSMYVRSTYEITLPWTKALLEPMDLVTLTDAGLGYDKLPVRVTEIEEDESGYLRVLCEDFPLGVASAAVYPSQSSAGFQHDYNAAPGSISAPLIFEAPGALTQNGLEVWVAATGTGARWGGCNVWVSLDGTGYRRVGTINGGSRYGALTTTAGTSGGATVQLIAGQLLSASAADASALNTLAYLCDSGGANPEWIAYQTATLGGVGLYTLGGTVVRGAYGSPAKARSIGARFARCDDAIAKSGPIDLGYVGKTIHVKCTSFNAYGSGEEDLSAVTDYTYTITGSQVYGNAGAAAMAGIAVIADDNVLAAGEKSAIILDYATITAEQSGIDAQATAYGITSEKSAYDSAVSALTSYLGTLATPVPWNNTSGDTTIVGATLRSKFGDVYAARQTLLNKIAQVSGTVANWSGVQSRPKTYRVGAIGYSAVGYPLGASIIDAETGTVLCGSPSGIYQLAKINRFTDTLTYVGGWYTLGSSANATAFANALAAIGNDHIVIVYTFDEPQSAGTRLQADLYAQMLRCGASRAVYGSPRFKHRAAYVLIGIPGCGEGNGYEAYQGDTDDDTNAWCDVTFQVLNGAFIVTGSGATPRTLADYSYTGDLAATRNVGALADLNSVGTNEIDLWAATAVTIDLGSTPITNPSGAAYITRSLDPGTYEVLLTCEVACTSFVNTTYALVWLDFPTFYGTVYGTTNLSFMEFVASGQKDYAVLPFTVVVTATSTLKAKLQNGSGSSTLEYRDLTLRCTKIKR